MYLTWRNLIFHYSKNIIFGSRWLEHPSSIIMPIYLKGCCGRDRMVVDFTTTCAVSADHHWSCEFESCSWWGVLDTTLCDKVCQSIVADRWFSPGTPVSSTNKTDHHYIAEMLLKVALNTIILTPLHLSPLWYDLRSEWVIGSSTKQISLSSHQM